MAIYVVFALAPLAVGSYFAFTNWDGLNAPHFVGLDNLKSIWADPQLRHVVIRTVLLGVGFVVGTNCLGLPLALGLHRKLRSHNFLRALFLAPAIVSPLAVGYVWRYMLQPDGAVNQILSAVGLDHLQRVWLGDPQLAVWAVLVTMVWQSTGLTMVIYLAGLQSIPPEFAEAAAVDGAGSLRTFRYITFPLLAPAITANVLISLIFGLKVYDQVLALTGGGPGGATETLSTTVVHQVFVDGDYGAGAASGLVLTVIVVAICIPLAVILRRREEA